MMYATSADPEELVECPYDKSHMIRAKRMPYHLMKCRLNSTKELAVCPFNARHEVPKPELRHHMANCPDKAVLEKDLAYECAVEEGTFFKGCTDVPSYNAYDVQSNENWEEDINPRPRIGVHPSFHERIQYRDITGFSKSQKKAFHRGLAPDPEPSTAEPAAVDINKVKDKLRLPNHASEALKISESHGQEKPVLPPPSVFMYSLALAGIGRGRGANPQQVDGVPAAQRQSLGIGRGTPPVSSAMPNSSSPYAMLAQMSQHSRELPSLPLAPLQQNNNNEAFGEELDDFLDQELAIKSDVTPERTGQSVEPQCSGSWSEQTEDFVESSNQVDVAPEYVLPAQPRSVGRGVTGVPRHVHRPVGVMQNGVTGRGQQQTDGYGECQGVASAPVPPPPGFVQPPVGIGRGRGAAVIRDVQQAARNEPGFVVPVVKQASKTHSAHSNNNDISIFNDSVISPDTSSGESSNVHGCEDAKKQCKKLQKKMRQIESLELKKKQGKQLAPEELEKLSKKNDFEKEMAALQLH